MLTSSERENLWLARLKPFAKGAAIGLLVVGLVLTIAALARAEDGTASWYSVESCKREGTWAKYGGRMANGEIFNDSEFVCASWSYPLGSYLSVSNISTNKTVIVRVTDRGPAKRLVKKGRIIDLSKGAFSQIADLKSGVIKVSVKRIK